MDQVSKSNSETEEALSNFLPKGYFLEYPFLIDLCVKRFIDDFQNSFVEKKGRYVLTKSLSNKNLEILFSSYLSEERSRIVSSISSGVSQENSTIVIVSSSGRDRHVSYCLKEKDIDIKIEKIEKIFNRLFDKFFKEQNKKDNFIFCKHSLLLSSDWETICRKKIFGKKNFYVLSNNLKVIEEKTSDEKVKTLSKEEQRIVVKEASDWILNQLCSSRLRTI